MGGKLGTKMKVERDAISDFKAEQLESRKV
jgi:hypothetical protein